MTTIQAVTRLSTNLRNSDHTHGLLVLMSSTQAAGCSARPGPLRSPRSGASRRAASTLDPPGRRPACSRCSSTAGAGRDLPEGSVDCSPDRLCRGYSHPYDGGFAGPLRIPARRDKSA
jgi:hypothetical protein